MGELPRSWLYVVVAVIIGLSIYFTADLVMSHLDKWVEQGIANSRNVIER